MTSILCVRDFCNRPIVADVDLHTHAHPPRVGIGRIARGLASSVAYQTDLMQLTQNRECG